MNLGLIKLSFEEKISMLVKVLLNTGDKFSGLLKRVFQENDAKTCSLALDLYWEILKKSVFSTHFCDNSLNCEICTRGFDAFQQFVLENCSGPRYSAYIRNSLTSMLLDKKWSMYKPVAMSQSVICPGVWKSYFSAMKGVTDESLIKQSLMDVSSLLIENSDNWSDLAKQENWPMWIFELTIPDFESMSITNLAEKKRPNKVIVDISEVQKLSLNVITLILNRKMFQTWTFIHDLRLIFSKIRCIFHLDKEKIWIISALVMNALLKRASFDFESSKPDCSSSVYWQNLKFELKIFDLITFMPDLWSSISVDNEIRVKHENASQFTKFAFRNSAFRDALLIILRSMIHFLKCFKHDRNAGIFKSKDSVLDGKKETFISRISEFYVGVVDLLEKEHIELDSKEYLSMLEQSIHTLRLKLYPESRKIFVKKIK